MLSLTKGAGLVSGMLCLAWVASVQADTKVPAPMLFWNFNSESHGIVKSTGSHEMDLTLYSKERVVSPMLGKSGSGVSGKMQDKALDLNSAEGMGGERESEFLGGGAKGTSLEDVFNGSVGIASFTITAWVNTEAPAGNNAQILNQSSADSGGFRLYLRSDNMLVLNMVGETGRKDFKLGKLTEAPGEWIFLVVTFDNSAGDGLVSFYQGTVDSPLVLISTKSAETGNFIPGTSTLAIGNWSANSAEGFATNRPFKGFIDNVGLWFSESDGSAALTLEQLEAARQRQDTGALR